MLVGLFSRPFDIGLFSSIQQEFPSIKRNCLFSRRLYLMIPSPICVNTFSDPKQKNLDPQKCSWRRTLSWNITRQDKGTKSMQMGSCTSDVYTSLKYLVIFEDNLFDLLFVRNLPPTEELQFPRYIIQQLSTVCNFGCSTMYQCNCSGYSRGGTLTIPAIGLEDPPFGTCTIFTMHCIIHIFHHNHQNCHYLCDYHQHQ